jgi:hypothetical protein
MWSSHRPNWCKIANHLYQNSVHIGFLCLLCITHPVWSWWTECNCWASRLEVVFLEAVCIEKGPSRAIFGWPIRAVRKSLAFSHIFLLLAVIRTQILFGLKVSQLLQLCVYDLRPTSTAIKIPHFNKFHLHPQYLDCNFVSCSQF